MRDQVLEMLLAPPPAPADGKPAISEDRELKFALSGPTVVLVAGNQRRGQDHEHRKARLAVEKTKCTRR